MANIQRPRTTKLTMDNLSKPMQMDEATANTTWAKLESAIGQIHQQNASGLSFEELYRTAYNMVLHRHGDKLYQGMERCLTQHLRGMAADFLSLTGMRFIEEILSRWVAYHKSTQMIRDILMYMDRTFVKHVHKTPVFDRGLQIWTAEIIHHKEIGPRLKGLLLELVAKERAGEVIDRLVFRSVTKMLLELGTNVYIVDFEMPFLEESTQYFKAEVQKCLATMDCPAYWIAVERRLTEEQDRVKAYLDPTTEAKLLSRVDHDLIKSQMELVLSMEHSGLVQLIEADKRDDLARVYRLLRRIGQDGLLFLKRGLHDHVKKVGLALVEDGEATKDAIALVGKLLDMKDKYTTTIAESFAGDRQFVQTLNQAFEVFLNTFNRSPEYVSLFLDNKLRKGMASLSDNEADDTLDKALQLFRYLQDKDVFERFYKQHLAKRLLGGKITSDDAERSLLSKLKTECGYQFTSKLEQMFTDMKTSQDTMAMFRLSLQTQRIELMADINVQVLTTGSWPTATQPKCALPMELEQCTRVFHDFYKEKHNGRNLVWHTSMGTADLKASFYGRKKEINVTTYQMCLLLLFNDQPSYTFSELADATKIGVHDLRRALQGLAMVKGKALLKKSPPGGKEIATGDAFCVNDKFDSKLFKIKFAAAGAQKEADPETGTRGRVEEDRKHHIEAAIVRIMKARRVLDYNSIVTEVTRQLSGRFQPQPSDVKKRMECLIEREFIERDANDRKMYHYLA